MRKKDKEITDKAELESIINKAQICRLAMFDESYDRFPYIVPMNFAYKDDVLYFHCAKKGQKIDLINSNHRVCFEMDIDHEIKTGKKPCDWTMTYRSIVGYGDAMVMEDEQETRKALDLIMLKYSKNMPDSNIVSEAVSGRYSEAVLKNTNSIQVRILQMTGKKSG